MPGPTTPGAPAPAPGQPPAPQQPVAQPQADPGAGLASSQVGQAGSSIASAAPNMMGDLLGARSVRIGFDRIARLGFSIPGGAGTPGVSIVPGQLVQARLDPLPGQSGNSIILNTTDIAQRLSQLDSFTQPLTADNLANITPDQARAARAVLQAVVSGRAPNAQDFATLPPNLQAQLVRNPGLINTLLAQGIAVPGLTVQSVGGGIENGQFVYNALLTGGVNVPLPGSSSTVGRVKLSEDNNPIPRDRFIFNYDTFSNVPFTTNGITVNRFQFGVEKTFRDGRDSIEFRIPFAGTLNSTSVQGAEGTATELGNLRFAYKHLWTRNQRVNFTSGLGVTLPTADDQIVNLPDGTNLYTFKNESVQLEPFIALLLTPNDRLFGQVWSSVNFDANGGNLTYNRDIFGGSGSQRIIDLPYLAVDGQIGYWVFRSPCNAIRGVAPFVELHWNYAIAQRELLRSLNRRVGNTTGLTVSGVADQELNLTAGVTTQIGDNMTLTLGGSAPLFDRPERTFDGQFGLRLNYFFGRTARERSAASYISSY
jgi:hypothetical protein